MFEIIFNVKAEIRHLIFDKLFLVISFLVIFILAGLGIKNTVFAKPTKKETNPFKILAFIVLMVLTSIGLGILSVYGVIHGNNY
jgi:hypothetical protein